MKPMKKELVFEVGKFYVNRNGKRLRCLCTDRPGEFPIVLMYDNGEIRSFTSIGLVNPNGTSSYDIVGEAPETASVTRYFFLAKKTGNLPQLELYKCRLDAEHCRTNLSTMGYKCTDVKELQFEGEFNG